MRVQVSDVRATLDKEQKLSDQLRQEIRSITSDSERQVRGSAVHVVPHGDPAHGS